MGIGSEKWLLFLSRINGNSDKWECFLKNAPKKEKWESNFTKWEFTSKKINTKNGNSKFKFGTFNTKKRNWKISGLRATARREWEVSASKQGGCYLNSPPTRKHFCSISQFREFHKITFVQPGRNVTSPQRVFSDRGALPWPISVFECSILGKCNNPFLFEIWSFEN